MEYIIAVVILVAGGAHILGFPVLVWNSVGSLIFGVRNFHAASFWIYLCEFLTVYLIPLNIVLYRKVRTDRPFLLAGGSLVTLALLVVGFITMRNTIIQGRQGIQTYDEWKASILSACQSYPVNASPTGGSLPAIDRVWVEAPFKITYVDREEFTFLQTYSTPAQWNSAVHVISLIEETYADSGYEYVDSTGLTSGVRAVRYTWFVSICDLQTKQRINTTLVGPEPPAKLTSSQNGGVYGIQPNAEYDAWVATLTGK